MQEDVMQQAFGLWQNRNDIDDGLRYQERIRSEWTENNFLNTHEPARGEPVEPLTSSISTSSMRTAN